mgnify:CR=1 FL=1
MTNELKETQALIDKIRFTNISIEDIEDLDQLQEQEYLTKESGKMKYITNSGKEFNHLTIKDDVVDIFSAGTSKLNGNCIPHTKMELSIHGKTDGNLYCNTVLEYEDQLIQTQEYLWNKYGVKTNSENLKVSYIEINKTFRLEHPFAEYKRPIILLMSRLPKNKGVQMDFKSLINRKYKINDFAVSNNSSAIKIYDKSSQMQIEAQGELMRVELTLKDAKTVKGAFKTNIWNELTDEAINEYFNTQMKKLFSEPVERWNTLQKKKIVKMMEEKKDKEHHWIGAVLGCLQDEEVLTGIPQMMDIKELLPIVDQVVASRRKKRTKEQFIKQAQNVQTAFNNRDDEKLKEILKKMMSVPDWCGSDQ